MRIYVPATSMELLELHEQKVIGVRGVTAFAVTEGLRQWYTETDSDADVEELEYAAARQAARASLRLVDGDPTAARRRVVVSADVPDVAVAVRDELERGAVRVSEPIPLDAVAAIHIDDAGAELTVAAAAAVVIEADLGLESAQDAVDDAEGYELSWYAPQELDRLLAELRGSELA